MTHTGIKAEKRRRGRGSGPRRWVSQHDRLGLLYAPGGGFLAGAVKAQGTAGTMITRTGYGESSTQKANHSHRDGYLSACPTTKTDRLRTSVPEPLQALRDGTARHQASGNRNLRNIRSLRQPRWIFNHGRSLLSCRLLTTVYCLLSPDYWLLTTIFSKNLCRRYCTDGRIMIISTFEIRYNPRLKEVRASL